MSIYNTYQPPNFHSLNAYLFVEDPIKQIAFMEAAFEAKEINRTLSPGSDEIANCIMHIGDSVIMLSQATGPFSEMRSSFYLYVNDVDLVYKRALKEGAVKVFEPEDMDYGDRQAGVKDLHGNYWWISKRLINKPYEN